MLSPWRGDASWAILVHVPGHEHLDGPICLSTRMLSALLSHTCTVGSRGSSRPAAYLPTGPVPGRSPLPAVGSGWESSRKTGCCGFQLLGPLCWGVRSLGQWFLYPHLHSAVHPHLCLAPRVWWWLFCSCLKSQWEGGEAGRGGVSVRKHCRNPSVHLSGWKSATRPSLVTRKSGAVCAQQS